MEVMELNIICELENPIRLKITGKCNRKCFFCHKEGGMNIDDIHVSKRFIEIIERLSSELNMHSIAITGGEPLLYQDFEMLIEKLMECEGIHKFSITTNGTIFKPKSFWEKLKKYGLYKVNISMPDILDNPHENLKTKLVASENTSVFEKQLETIKILDELGVEVKINVAVINDVWYTSSVLGNLLNEKDLRFDIVLLPNITSDKTFEYSQKIISELCKVMNFEMVGVRKRNGTSNAMFSFENNLKQRIYIKTTKLNGIPVQLKSVCSSCEKKESCQEGFYGIRMEQYENEFYIRLCIHKSSSDVLLQIDDFWASDAYKELKQIWGS